MISNALISLLSFLINAVAFVLPSGTFLPSNFSDLVSDFVVYAYGWDWILPIGTLFSVFSAILVFFVAEVGWRGGKYVISLFRGN